MFKIQNPFTGVYLYTVLDAGTGKQFQEMANSRALFVQPQRCVVVPNLFTTLFLDLS